jgi:HSP20 family protein
MEHLHRIHLRQIESRLGGIAYQLTRIQFGSVTPQDWSPSINAYQCSRQVVICVDLAGVDKSQIKLSVEPRRLLLRGRRRLLAPEESEGPLHVLAMEIDEGVFARELLLPREVDPAGVRAEQRNGILWIWLPLAVEGA